jgi:lipid-A-disaccharide synthase-like uncharacterized protein
MIHWLRGFLPESPAAAAWLALGMLGQAIFGLRWLLQIVASERRREVTIPQAFWWLSVAGGLMVLASGLYQQNLVLVIGQWGIAVYLRNLVLLRRARARLEAAGGQGA